MNFWRACNAFESLKALAQITLNIPASGLSIDRMWSSADKIMDQRRSLQIETTGRLIFIRHTWQVAQRMLDLYGAVLSPTGPAYYKALLPFGKGLKKMIQRRRPPNMRSFAPNPNLSPNPRPPKHPNPVKKCGFG